ncbi:MAG TPA: tRNA (adenosine(37)-N6)-threonylcarbamoyltransferase complex ATPase subunit type 1 TsaE [Syntrophomonadaceae bacterium]|nr:tRNA (adenosine(37)-N6)-threonylcarbamoyltransferase complex ATPase subunit type 1 TsaE [Syntrophomonadaceae bacterium]
MEILVDSATNMRELGKKLSKFLEPQDVVYLIGDLGAGKTTMVQGIALGFNYAGRVTSPTFTLMNIYETSPIIYHFDFYRLDGEELEDLGLDDYLERDGIAIIEWPNLTTNLLPAESLIIRIELTNEDYDLPRLVSFKALGERYDLLIEELKKEC